MISVKMTRARCAVLAMKTCFNVTGTRTSPFLLSLENCSGKVGGRSKLGFSGWLELCNLVKAKPQSPAVASRTEA